jgi:hypothetical protein
LRRRNIIDTGDVRRGYSGTSTEEVFALNRVFSFVFFLFVFVSLATVLIYSTAEAVTLFEDDFSGDLGDWELTLGGGTIEIGSSDPPEYGPKVLIMNQASAVNTLAVVKDLEFTDGIIEILWRDANLPEDVDGPLIARKQPAGENWYLLELDTDTGLHFDIVGGAGVIGAGQMSTGEWTWIKWRLEGAILQARAWLAGDAEPGDWELEIEDATYTSGGVGLRCYSGVMEAAYYRVTDLDGPGGIAVEPEDRLTTTWGEIKR